MSNAGSSESASAERKACKRPSLRSRIRCRRRKPLRHGGMKGCITSRNRTSKSPGSSTAKTMDTSVCWGSENDASKRPYAVWGQTWRYVLASFGSATLLRTSTWSLISSQSHAPRMLRV
ncbi:hypothetical protein GSI_07203 [Ganoderma sinense ZZ0214-1]|uniref:Uncharacterized protein n=1 Tax=Ganoderma sinense ZZ0214-1 TaxID=1077348 RepID=A0A2G8S9R4_9APHY|nr:hypothetical protein GSI_07203 [Ganoderma sinense ZZ0214-1]